MIQVFKIRNNIDLVDKNKMFTLSDYTSTREHPLKIYKRRFRLNLRGNYFSNRTIDTWNELPTNVVMAPTLNSFKTRLNKYWYGHPLKSEPWCYIPGERSRLKIPNTNASTAVLEPIPPPPPPSVDYIRNVRNRKTFFPYEQAMVFANSVISVELTNYVCDVILH